LLPSFKEGGTEYFDHIGPFENSGGVSNVSSLMALDALQRDCLEHTSLVQMHQNNGPIDDDDVGTTVSPVTSKKYYS
jgi:hypothetical protein